MAAEELAVDEKPASKEPRPKELNSKELNSKDHDSTTQKELMDDGLLAADEKSFQDEVIKNVEKQFSLENLRKLKPEEGAKNYLEESKKQIIKLCQCLENLPLHTEVHTVILNIKVGEILNDIKEWCKSNRGISKTTFNKWRKENFEDKHRRYFFQARQLASMGEEAYRYAYLGKNRLLEFESIRNSINKKEETSKSLDDVFKSQPYSSNGNGDKGAEKDHVDAIITLHRFRNEDVKTVTFSHAEEMVSVKHGAITVSTAKQIKTVLDTVKTEKQKKELIADYLKNKKLPDNLHLEVTGKFPNGLLKDIVKYCDGIKFDDKESVSKIKEEVEKNSVIEAYRKIIILAKQLEIDLSQEQDSDPKANT